MVIAANLGFPRIGVHRELKKALESYWKGEMTEHALKEVAKELRKTHWTLQHRAGIKHVPSNDFSFYDQVLDTIALVGAVPERYGFKGDKVDLATYFAMARGVQNKHEHAHGETCNHAHQDAAAMEMTKWFDTNYHYIVPELHAGQKFQLASDKIFDEFKEAKLQGLHTRPVLLGPVSFLLLAKMKGETKSTLSLLPELLPVYERVLKQLAALGADWVQID